MMINFRKVPHLPRFNTKPIVKVKTIFGKATSTLIAHKVLVIVLISFLVVGGVGIGVRSYFISKIKIAQNNSSNTSFSNYSPAPSSPVASDNPSLTDTSSPADNSVLGTSTDSTRNSSFGGGNTLSAPTPFPSILPTPTYTPTPEPSSTPTVTVISNSTSSVTSSSSLGTTSHTYSSMGVSSGVPTAWYSETSSPQTVSSVATISIQLQDCNNNTAPVSDTLTITQSSGPGTTVNSSTPPISIETTNGQASFTVSSQIAGTAVYIVTDTTHSFTVTDPGNHSPQVTFTVSAPTPTPTPTPSPTPTSTPTPTPTPSSSDSPTPSPTPLDTPTPNPSPSSI